MEWKWLATSGSPFLLIEKKYAPAWRGIGEDDKDPEDDYALACTVYDYAGIVIKEEYSVVVFGDESFPVAILPEKHELWFVRWIYAPDRKVMEETVRTFDPDLYTPVEELYIPWKSKDVVFFDSVLSYEEAIKEDMVFHFSVEGFPNYLRTFLYEEGEVSFLLHQLTRDKTSDMEGLEGGRHLK